MTEATLEMRADATAAGSAGGRFTPAAQALHWITAPLMAVVLVLGWYMKALPRDLPARQGWYDLHEATGVTILLITAARLLWRWAHPAPPLPGRMGAIERGLALASHVLLYLVLLAMPLSGYLLMMAKGHSLNYFWLFTVPQFVPSSDDLASVARTLHGFGHYAVVGLVALHVLATAWHVAVRRDGMLDRMLPARDGG